MTIEEKLKSLGISLPPCPKPQAKNLPRGISVQITAIMAVRT